MKPNSTIRRGISTATTARTTATPGSPEKLANAVTKGILARRFAVGQRLTEIDLMQAFGVGRSTVREGLRVLAASGVVQLQPHRGAVVRALDEGEARDLLQVLEVLSGLAARLAAQAIADGDHRERFTQATANLLAGGDGEALSAMLDQRASYYQVMFDIGGSVELQRAMPLARAHLLRTQFHDLLGLSELRAMRAEYQGISQAILEGDARLAELRMRTHIRKSAQRMLPSLRPAARRTAASVG